MLFLEELINDLFFVLIYLHLLAVYDIRSDGIFVNQSKSKGQRYATIKISKKFTFLKKKFNWEV